MILIFVLIFDSETQRPRRGNVLLCSQEHVFSCHLLIGIGMLSVEKFSYCFGRKFSFAHIPKVPGEVDGLSWQEVRGGGRGQENEKSWDQNCLPAPLFS